jgi:hypothetical protein
MLPGLTLKERPWKLHCVTMLYYAPLLGDGACSPHGDFARSTLGGFGSCTFKSFATNAAATTQALAGRTSSQRKVLPNALRIRLRAWVETDDLDTVWIGKTQCVFAASGGVAALARQDLFCNIYPRNAR